MDTHDRFHIYQPFFVTHADSDVIHLSIHLSIDPDITMFDVECGHVHDLDEAMSCPGRKISWRTLLQKNTGQAALSAETTKNTKYRKVV